jgi:threonine dehydrogenase-like Zn-dependent dehydrogenase
MAQTALRYYVSTPRYLLARALNRRMAPGLLPLQARPAALVERPGWTTGRVLLSGICGSDLALLYGKSALRLSPFFSFPAILGHEVLAEVEGTRMVLNPLLGCADRGFDPVCPACARRAEGLCSQAAEPGSVSPGMIGYCRDAPGGWGPAVAAPARSWYPVPGEVPDERALLAEPLAVAVRGIARAFGAGWPESLLVIGAGAVGLITVGALRALGFAGYLAVSARYPRQGDLAQDLGASAVYATAEAAMEAVGGRRYPSLARRPARRGGYGGVVEASGSGRGLDEAAWSVTEGGTLLLLGAPAELQHDFSPHWFRELRLTGSYTYSQEEFRRAVDLLPELPGLERIVTHTFPTSDWRTALGTARSPRSIKVAFRPG